jgi:hypothetical protein
MQPALLKLFRGVGVPARCSRLVLQMWLMVITRRIRQSISG